MSGLATMIEGREISLKEQREWLKTHTVPKRTVPKRTETPAMRRERLANERAERLAALQDPSCAPKA
jgi:hypothetical protein